MVMIGALILVGITVFLILQPLISGKGAPLHGGREDFSEAQFRKRVSLLQLRDAEYEFAMGKLGQEDFEILKKEISAEALAAIRAEELEANAGEFPEGGFSDSELEEEIARARAQMAGGVFCSECGRPNLAGSRFCAECGTPLQATQPSPTS
jgi:hypothetical protein